MRSGSGHRSGRVKLTGSGRPGLNEFLDFANVCHAYQLLKKWGLKDENIIVFMYDDIAYHPENPRPGVILNSPHGNDVFEGVPKIRKRVLYNGTFGSHIMQYGDLHIHEDALSIYMGSNSGKHTSTNNNESLIPSRHVNQRDVHILYLKSKFQTAPEGSTRKIEAYRQLSEAISEREHVDNNVRHIGVVLFGVENAAEVVATVRPAGQSLVDDWDCLKSFWRGTLRVAYD
ncbi:hypothetical protein RND71_030869 [Anisodus tanguticus]|uniref:Legumain prodomain domain-containing protein n=1 Tax=Anisodus tanguticus TaxID=243964 RepID=A0AAE1RGW6_9SOLA|nr:hypothetical protein RND71_030869 [Anisodus tanguticus]